MDDGQFYGRQRSAKLLRASEARPVPVHVGIAGAVALPTFTAHIDGDSWQGNSERRLRDVSWWRVFLSRRVWQSPPQSKSAGTSRRTTARLHGPHRHSHSLF